MKKKSSKEVRTIRFNPVHLVAWILLCETAGIIGGFFTAPAIPTWYAGLAKPWFSPPNWLFAPVWTTLYALMGVSAYRIWRLGVRRKEIKSVINLFLIHLVVNALWSLVFFGLKNISLALFIIVLLWILIYILIKRFSKIDPLSSYLLVPYLGWVSFATLLNFALWVLNP